MFQKNYMTPRDLSLFFFNRERERERAGGSCKIKKNLPEFEALEPGRRHSNAAALTKHDKRFCLGTGIYTRPRAFSLFTEGESWEPLTKV